MNNRVGLSDTRPFPIQGEHKDENGVFIRSADGRAKELLPCTVPWWLAEIAYEEYSRRYGTSQSLEQLAERGGFGRWELLLYLEPKTAKLYKNQFGPAALKEDE